MSTSKQIILVSSCLVGLCTRYDGKLKTSDQCLKQVAGAIWIPVCPEQLGGLPTPREAADLFEGDGEDVLCGVAKVITKGGRDVTDQFIKGATQVLSIATQQEVDRIFLKSRSPSCGVSGRIGVTAALLQQHGFEMEEF